MKENGVYLFSTTANFLLALVLPNKTSNISNLFCYLEQEQVWQNLEDNFRGPGSFSTGEGFPKLPSSPNIYHSYDLPANTLYQVNSCWGFPQLTLGSSPIHLVL